MKLTSVFRLVRAASLTGSILLVPALAAAQPTPQPVFDLVGQRLLQMRGVALYRAQHGLPVADDAREVVVLQKAEESAAAAGLDPLTVTAFYRVQIKAAKAIQYRYLADWSFQPDVASWPAEDLVSQIRPRLIELGDALTSALGAFLSAQGCFRPDPASALPGFHLRRAPERNREARIFESMSQIDFAPPHDQCAASATVSPAVAGSGG